MPGQENFVRRNLKRKGLSKYKATSAKRNARKKELDDDEYVSALVGDDEAEENEERQTTSTTVTASSSSSATMAVHGKLANWGVDSLSLALHLSTDDKSLANRLSELSLRKLIEPTIPLLALESSETHIRGLTNIENPLNKSRPVASLQDSTSYTKEMCDVLKDLAPTCSGHALATQLFTVRKSGRNKGRRFYGCSFPADQRCDYFLWAEDNPELIAVSMRLANSPLCLRAGSESKAELQGPVAYCLYRYRERLEKLSREELSMEVRRFQTRRMVSQQYLCHLKASTETLLHSRCTQRLTVTGSRADLTKRLLSEAKFWLSLHFSESCLSQDSSHDMPPVSEDLIALSDDSDSSSDSEASSVPIVDHTASCGTIEMVALSDSDDESDEDCDENESTPKSVSDMDEEDNVWEPGDSQCSATNVESMWTSSRLSGREGNDSIAAKEIPLCPNIVRSLSSELQESSLYAVVLSLASRIFGHDTLREGQWWAIRRVLQSKRSLLILPTGAGKTLTFALSALMLPGLTIVVSPLIALMQDQLNKLPIELPAMSLSHSQSVAHFQGLVNPLATAKSGMGSKSTNDWIERTIIDNQIKLLFVSPERLVSTSFRKLIRQLRSRGGLSISLLCIDEAHCLSQWSLHFRPAFMRIQQELKVLAPQSVLALTATASEQVRDDVAYHLDIKTPINAIEANELIVRRERVNLLVHFELVLNDDEKRDRIQKLLTSGRALNDTYLREWSPFHACDAFLRDKLTNRHISAEEHQALRQSLGSLPSAPSHVSGTSMDSHLQQPFSSSKDISEGAKSSPITIVYVPRRIDASIVCESLKAHDMNVGLYHGGLDSDKRTQVQRDFERGKARIVVATVAFGLGVDKQDVRQVLHQGLPRSLDAFAQEIGRGGRDGLPSTSVCVFTAQDACVNHSLNQGTRISECALLGFLTWIFPLNIIQQLYDDCSENNQQVEASGSEFVLKTDESLSLSAMETSLGLSASSTETLATLLSLRPFELLSVCGTHTDLVQFRFRISLQELSKVCMDDPFVREIVRIARPQSKKNHQQNDTTTTNATERATFFADDARAHSLGLQLQAHQRQLKNQDTKEWAFLTDWLTFSRFDLAKTMNTSVDDVSLRLFRLQRSGLCYYSLSDSCLHVRLRASAIRKHMTRTSSATTCKDSYVPWLLELTRQLVAQQDESLKVQAQAVEHMWRAAWAISVCDRPVSSNHADPVSAVDAEKYQSQRLSRAAAVQRLLSAHILGTEAVGNTTNTDADNELHAAFRQAPLPFAPLRNQMVKQKQQLAQAVLTVSKEPSITQRVQSLSGYAVRRLLAMCGPSSLTADIRSELTTHRAHLVALQVCKVLQGLGENNALSARVAEEHFGQYRSTRFEDLLEETISILRRQRSDITNPQPETNDKH